MKYVDLAIGQPFKRKNGDIKRIIYAFDAYEIVDRKDIECTAVRYARKIFIDNPLDPLDPMTNVEVARATLQGLRLPVPQELFTYTSPLLIAGGIYRLSRLPQLHTINGADDPAAGDVELTLQALDAVLHPAKLRLVASEGFDPLEPE